MHLVFYALEVELRVQRKNSTYLYAGEKLLNSRQKIVASFVMFFV